MKKIIFLFIAALATSCSTINVSYDFDKTTDFTKYKTYAYSEDALKLAISDLNRDRMLNAIDAEMSVRGMTKSDNPDVLVDLIVKAEKKVEANATNVGGGYYGRYGYARGFGTTQISYDEYVVGTLFINVVDKSVEKIVWQGRGTKTIDENASPQKRESNINYAVKSIFYNYPVKPKAK
jgi:hypothetical protein